MDAAWEMAKPDSPAYFKFIWKYLVDSNNICIFAAISMLFIWVAQKE
jgi:hypothetical protein